MKLNDPFGRMARRREREYESLKQALLKAGMTDEQKARELIENLAKRSKTGMMVLIPLVVILALLFREYAIFVLAFGALILLWLFNTTRRGQDYIGRYIEDVCRQPGETQADDEPAEQALVQQHDPRQQDDSGPEQPPKA
ncbi:hypothetical protein ACQUQP_08635 [Marinobacterium sp. YM272]|uniref:hypothetical protein n=1 Tax=Marinobacterium sp. YM272 TaxID=3421654 RepID=UPI003D7F7A9E